MSSKEETAKKGLPQRTLFIGIGGSGRDVLQRVRRWVFERWRQSSLPFTRFLWIDTDPNGRVPTDIDNIISDKVRFKGKEFLPLEMKTDAVLRYFTAGTTNNYTGKGSTVDSWLPKEIQSYVHALRHGAGQIRSFGRLAFWDHAADFNSRVEIFLNEMSARSEIESQSRELGYEGIADDIKVVIVTGLAGGTGSGAFIDAGILVRAILRRKGIPNYTLSAFLLMPDIFIQMRLPETAPETLGANGYAALKELDVLLDSDGSQTQEVYRFPNIDEDVPVIKPVFDLVWLVDRVTSDGQSLDNPMAPFRMIADAMTLELDITPFAQTLRTAHSNLIQSISEPMSLPFRDDDANKTLLYSIPVHRRYALIGESHCAMDRHRFRNVAAFRLGEHLARFMRGKTISLDNKQINDHLIRAGLEPKSLLREVMLLDENQTVLEWWHNEIDKKIQPITDQYFNQLTNLQGSLSRNKIARMEQMITGPVAEKFREIRREIHEQITRPHGLLFTEGGRHVQGAHYLKLEENIKTTRERVLKKIHGVFIKFLANPMEYGTMVAEQFLDAASEMIQKMESMSAHEIPQKSLQPPKISGNAELIRCEHRLGAARQIPVIFIPFRTIAEKIARDEYETEMERQFQKFSLMAKNHVSDLRQSIINNVNALYMEHIWRNRKKLLGLLQQGLSGELHVRRGESDENLLIDHVGLKLALNRFVEQLDHLQAGQKQMADAFRDTNQGTHNVELGKDVNEVDELFQICFPEIDSFSTSREAVREQALLDLMAQYFARSGFISKEKTQQILERVDGVHVDALLEGMQAILERAQDDRLSQASWEDIRKKLELFCFEFTQPFLKAAHLDAASQLASMSNVERNNVLGTITQNSQPLFRLSDGWNEVRPTKRAYIGINPNYIESSKKWLGNMNISSLPNNTSTIPMEVGNLVIYQDTFAVPVVLLEPILSQLRHNYYSDIKGDSTKIYLRHRDQDVRYLPDICIQEDRKIWQLRKQAFKFLHKAILLGLVSFNHDTRDWCIGIIRSGEMYEIILGVTIDASTQYLVSDEDAFYEVEQRVITFEHNIGQAKEGALISWLAAYAAAAYHLHKKVYPFERQQGNLALQKKNFTQGQVIGRDIFNEIVYEKLHPALKIKAQPSERMPQQIQTMITDAMEKLKDIPYTDRWCRSGFKYVEFSDDPLPAGQTQADPLEADNNFMDDLFS